MSDNSSVGRVSGIVYAALTLLAVTVAATAKGYVDSTSEFAFLTLVSAIGLALAHFWSHVLAGRLSSSTVDRRWLIDEAISSSAMLIPAAILVLVELVMSLFTDVASAITVSMVVLLILLFVYTWVGERSHRSSTLSSLGWAAGTAGVGVLMIIFKVVA